MTKKAYQSIKLTKLGNLAGITMGPTMFEYDDGNSGMTMSFAAGNDDGMFSSESGVMIKGPK